MTAGLPQDTMQCRKKVALTPTADLMTNERMPDPKDTRAHSNA